MKCYLCPPPAPSGFPLSLFPFFWLRSTLVPASLQFVDGIWAMLTSLLINPGPPSGLPPSFCGDPLTRPFFFPSSALFLRTFSLFRAVDCRHHIGNGRKGEHGLQLRSLTLSLLIARRVSSSPTTWSPTLSLGQKIDLRRSFSCPFSCIR